MKKALYLFLVLVIFSPPVISQQSTQESSWKYFLTPTTAIVDAVKTKAIIEKDLLVVYNVGKTTRYFQTDFVKEVWNSYVSIPDSMAVVFKISESSQIEDIKDMAISVPIQDSTSFSFSKDTKISLTKEWQKITIPGNKIAKNVGKIYLRIVIILKDDSTLKPIEVVIEIKQIIGLYGDGSKYFFHGSEELTDVKNETIPTKIALSQNYPNPFNPTTSIRFSIPKQEFVNLKVYDILGKEIATLVDEVKSAGNYEVKFNASKLTSGMYIYRLQSGKSVETKKMILMK